MNCSIDELFAVLLARDLRPGDKAVMAGANMPAPRAAAALASLTHLPDTRVMLGFGMDNLSSAERPMGTQLFTLDPRTLQTGEAWMRQGEVFDYASFPEVATFSGYQVDRRGNLNAIGIRDGNGGWRVRSPGALAQPSFSTTAKGYYLLMARHTPQTFVERVDFISALGDRDRRRELQFPGGGVRLIISPLGVFDLDEGGDLRVRSLHEGVTADAVAQATGFELDVPVDVALTVAPTVSELALLRERVDPGGILSARP